MKRTVYLFTCSPRYQEKMRQERRRLEELKKGEKEYKKVQKPVVSLEAEIKPFDTIRKKLLLEFFIEHFIKMAEKSNIFRKFDYYAFLCTVSLCEYRAIF